MNNVEGHQDRLPVFMQVHTFYLPYLDTFYNQCPSYTKCSFREQINALVRDGFSANHMIAPYMDQLGYETHLVVANNPYSQAQWMKENAVIVSDEYDWIYEITRRQIDNVKPDVLYLSDPIAFDSNFVRTLQWRPKLILGWRAADIPSETNWSEFDAILSCLTGLREVALMLGAKSSDHFFPGFPVWMNNLTPIVEPEYDVVFSGSWTTVQHQHRNDLLQVVAEDAKNNYSCAYFLNSWNTSLPPEVASINHGARFGVEMYKALCSGRINIDARANHKYFDQKTNQYIDMGRNETANMRIFEATGCGCFLLTEYFDNLGDFFEIGKEIETFRSIDELKYKIQYYLAHPAEREAIARRGQERCLRDYSMEKRAIVLDSIIKKHMNKTTKEDIYVSDLKCQAQQALSDNRIQDAFQIIIKAKSYKKPQESLDLLRAECFLRMNVPDAAIQALLEELRLFPDNTKAIELLDSLQARTVTSSRGMIDNAEFQMILSKIRPFTMLGEERLYNLYVLAKYVCENDIPGNFVECGVAAGGSSALLAYVIKQYSQRQRFIFAFDSFEGMPEPTDNDISRGIDAESTGWGTGTCAAPENSVRMAAMTLGVLHLVKPVKGYFENTLPTMQKYIGEIGFLHMDADWYESIKTILQNLYDSLVSEALIQVDDYGYWDGCKKALHEFEATRNIRFSINNIDGNAVWFKKPSNHLKV